MFLDLSIGKILVLAVIALVVFGPDQLPKMAHQLGHTLRELRKLADGATKDLREGLGPESEGEYLAGQTATATLAREETPPFDPEAT